MITLNKLNGVPFILNCEMIETVAANPDTTITLTNGTFYIVRESVDEVVEKTIAYRQKVFCHLLNPSELKSDRE